MSGLIAQVDEHASRRLALADLSALPRLGFKGRGTIPAIQARGIVVQPEPNRAFRQDDGSLCLVLGAGEVLLLSGLGNHDGLFGRLENEWRIEDEEGTYPVPRRDSHAWMAIGGQAAPEMFAKLCAVDLGPHAFADLAIAQTSVARLNAIVVRADSGSKLLFHLLADSASATYLRSCLLDAGAEFGGCMVEIEEFRSAHGRHHGESTEGSGRKGD